MFGRRIVVAGFLASALVFSTGCDVSGVTSVSSAADIENDLSSPVRLRLCQSGDCKDGFHPQDHTIAPGESYAANVSSNGVANTYLVSNPDGSRRFGCLPLVSLEVRRDEPYITVLVSEYVPCRDDINEDKFWPARWEHMK